MAYVGSAPNPGQNREVDDISSNFDGSTTAFTLQVGGSNVSPGSNNNIVVSLGGVIQNPGNDFTIAASTITFTTAPASGLSFFGIILGQQVDVAALADGTSPVVNELKAATIKGLSASVAAITLNSSDGTCTANITNKPNRNLFINGAMLVAQRGTSSTSTGYRTVDRLSTYHGNVDEAPTYSQADVAAGTTPYSLGFRKCFKITNGNRTSGANASDEIQVDYGVEAQDIANSGWDYTSASSFITLSYWVKSSVAQEFKAHVLTKDGTQYNFPYSLGNLSADTWTKVTIKIPGNPNLQIDNNNGNGLQINLFNQMGTALTGSVTEDTWAPFSASTRTQDQTLTWYTTDNATFEFTGVQLEVGSTATDFEHKSFAQEVALCQRYYESNMGPNAPVTTTDGSISSQWAYMGSQDSSTLLASTGIVYKVSKRTSPTVTIYNPSNTSTANRANSEGNQKTVTAVYGGINAAGRVYVAGCSAGDFVTYNWEANAEL